MSYALAKGTRWEPAPKLYAETWTRDRADTLALFEATYPRSPTGPQLDGITAVWRWERGAIRVEKRNGQTGCVVHRTWRQMIVGVANDLDWELSGDWGKDYGRFRNQVARRLDHLVDMGLLEGWESVEKPNGESLGILLRVPAGVAQSVEASLRAYRPARRPGAVSPGSSPRREGPETAPRGGSGGLSRPCGSTSLVVSPSSLTRVLWDERPRARTHEAPGSVDAIEQTCTPKLRPALRPFRTALRESERPHLLMRHAWESCIDPYVMLLACWELATEGKREPRLSLRWQAQFRRSAAQYDRIYGPGAAAEWIARRLNRFEDDERHDFETIRSAAYYVHTFKQVARRAARAARGAPKPRPWRSRKPQASSW